MSGRRVLLSRCEMPVSLTFYGSDAERFEEVREHLEDETALEHGNADVGRALLGAFDEDR